MSHKILGLDLGTNSIGWVVVETEDKKQFTLLDQGVRIFQEGVKIEKGVEGSKAAERTGYRSARRLKYRRKLRKINTLKVLIKHGYCPPLTNMELDDWKYRRIYPQSQAFRNWWLTDNEGDAEKRKAQISNPYYFRYLAASENLDLSEDANRYRIGRALYHLAQRRGFLSNRLESTKESEGAVKKSISDITQAKGEQTLGQYFYGLYQKGAKIRNCYTHREAHYLEEFKQICRIQQLPEEMVVALEKAIFYQRPLKSQKGLVGKCPFEPTKARCAVSHPLFEEYRMLCFLNNIKIKAPVDEKLRSLNEDERQRLISRFFLQRDHFDFEDLAKQLAPKKQYKYYKERDKNPEDWLFNFDMRTTVSGCPVSARLKSIFGDDWKNYQRDYVREKDGRKSSIDMDDVWHVLFTYDSNDKLKQFATERLNLNDVQTDEFLKIHLKQDYGSLSLKAIRKIVPYLREGLIYSHAVFLANMEQVLPAELWADAENRRMIREEIHRLIQTQNDEKHLLTLVNSAIKKSREEEAVWSKEAVDIYRREMEEEIKRYFGPKRYDQFSKVKKQQLEEQAFRLFETHMQKNNGCGAFVKPRRIDDRIRQFLSDNFGVNGTFDKLYHPSALDVYKPPVKGQDGNYYLGSPMVASVRNPMAMRSLHQLRKVVNELIREGVIDSSATIQIEMARDLMNANERKAFQSWQRDRESKRQYYAAQVRKHFDEKGISREPSADDVLKYQFWEEQKHKCLYTGEQIGLSEFLGADPLYDIEHTIPQSLSFDNSQVNKTLCQSRFNRAEKRNQIPSELKEHDAILRRIDHWHDEVVRLNKQINSAVKQARGAATKDEKDKVIQKRHRLTLERDYWKNKYDRFTMVDVPAGFKNSQLVDTGLITKYARLYLKTLFNHTYTVNGSTVADFRKLWGLQEAYNTKQRINHIHHCIDAITIACMTRRQYDQLARFYHQWEGLREDGIDQKPPFEKPWPTFTEDVKAIEKKLFVSHYTPDNLAKPAKKKLRKRGMVQYSKKGQLIVQTGDSVRGSLHKETFYGAIEREEKNKKGDVQKVIKYVVRKKLDMLTDADLKNIVDERIRTIVTAARQQEKGLRKQMDMLKKQLQKAEEWDEPAIRQEMVQLEQQIQQLYALPTKKGGFVPIKKVRLFQPTVTNPLPIKPQRDQSSINPKPHKAHYYAANDGNYFMAIYEGYDAKGKVQRSFEVINNLKAGQYYRSSVQKAIVPRDEYRVEGLIDAVKTKGKTELHLKVLLKTGTMVLFWDKCPEEIWDLEVDKQNVRLYKLVKFDKSGRLYFRHHQEARPASDLKEVYEISWDKACEQIRFPVSKFNALIEGVDFVLTPLGKIKRLI